MAQLSEPDEADDALERAIRDAWAETGGPCGDWEAALELLAGRARRPGSDLAAATRILLLEAVAEALESDDERGAAR